LVETEKLVAGKLGRPVKGPADPIVISVDEEYARRELRAGIGDTLVFDV